MSEVPDQSNGLPRLRAKLRKHFAGRKDFELDAELDVGPGVTILFGRSGAGKSTLLNCIAGISEPDEGHIVLEREGDSDRLFDSRQHASVASSRRSIGYVFQALALFPHLTVRQNVEYGISHLPAGEKAAKVKEALCLFGVQEVADRRPDKLSGGESQRVALARTLVTEPQVLLLDEPFSALDLAGRRAILEDFRKWHSARKIPILYVTHSRREAATLGDSMLLMEDGKIVGFGKPEAVLARVGEFDE